MAITALPTPPSRSDPTNFAVRADAFLLALPNFRTEANTLLSSVETKEIAAAASAVEAAAAAASSSASANISIWLSGTTYAEGIVRYDPTDFKSYRRKSAGSSTTRPALDATNWILLTGEGDVTLSGTQTITGAKTFSQTIQGNAATVTNGVYTVGDQTIAGSKTFSGVTKLSAGTAALPSFTFSAESAFDTGIYWISDGIIGFTGNGVKTGEIAAGGSLTMVGNITAYSDERLKKDWDNLGRDFIAELAVVKSGTYTRIDTGQRQVGVSAQSLSSILPEAVPSNKDGILSVAYGNAALVSCVELAREVVYLREELMKLKEDRL